jgi:hypothetical protein
MHDSSINYFIFLFNLDLSVRCNGKALHQNDYQIAEIRVEKPNEITEMILSFETPECSSNEKNLEIIIDKQNIVGWINYKFPYHPHGMLIFPINEKLNFSFLDDHLEPCGVINKD